MNDPFKISLEFDTKCIYSIEGMLLRHLIPFNPFENLHYCRIFISNNWIKEGEDIVISCFHKLRWAKIIDFAMYNKGFYTVSNSELLITELCSLKIRKIVFIGIRNYWEAKYSDLIDALTDYNIKFIMS